MPRTSVPPPAVNVPDIEGVKVCVAPDPTIVSALVRPFVVFVDVASETFPVSVCPVGPIERTPVFVTLPPE